MVDSCAATVITRPMAPLANDRAPYPLVCAGLIYAPISSKIELSGAINKTKGLNNIAIVNSGSCRRMDEDARKLRSIGSIKEIGT